jgi:hypothetical protein
MVDDHWTKIEQLQKPGLTSLANGEGGRAERLESRPRKVSEEDAFLNRCNHFKNVSFFAILRRQGLKYVARWQGDCKLCPNEVNLDSEQVYS